MASNLFYETIHSIFPSQIKKKNNNNNKKKKMLLHEFTFSSISLVALRPTGTIYQCIRDFFIGSWNTGSQLIHYITITGTLIRSPNRYIYDFIMLEEC